MRPSPESQKHSFSVWESGLSRVMLNIQADTSQEAYTFNDKHHRTQIPNKNLYIVLASDVNFILLFLDGYNTNVIQGRNDSRGV